MTRNRCSIAIWIGAIALISSCGSETKKESATAVVPDKSVMTEAQGFFQPLPETAVEESHSLTSEKIALGKVLFYDARLSKNNTQSCNTCHNLSKYGVENEATSKGDLGKNGNRNSPTVYNAALHFAQFWDGRAKDVEEQAGMPVLNPVEMNMPSEGYVVERLKKIEGYRKLFAAAFPDDKEPLTYANLRSAIGAFERTLITPGNFNKFIAGDPAALTEAEQKGLKEFINTGCTTCHNGALLGGGMFQKFPLYGDEYMSLTGSRHEDLGKMETTKIESDKFIFKVPSLINITETAPYFHDGSVAELDRAIRIMAKTQLNKDLSDEQVSSIKTFLGSLKGTLPASAIIAPVMP